MARKTTVVIRPEGIAAVEDRVIRTGAGVADAVAADARRGAPVKTGTLRSTIKVIPVGLYTWHIIVGTDYWSHIEYGTTGRNPVILPKVKKALWWPGLPYPIPRVNNHPGNKMQPFMRPAAYQRRAIWFNPSGTLVVTT